MVKVARQREWPRHLSTHTRAEDLTHNVRSRGPIRSALYTTHTQACKHSLTHTHIHTHTHTHTHTHRTLPTTVLVLETPFDIHVSSVYQTHTCMQAPIPTLCIPAKNTHSKGSRTQPIMSTLMPRSGIPVICSRATLSCDRSYYT